MKNTGETDTRQHSHGIQTALGNEELYFQMLRTNFGKIKVDHYQMEERQSIRFEHFSQSHSLKYSAQFMLFLPRNVSF